MSLHAQVNPEAQARLAAQRRNSTIASVVIALLVCVLLGLIFWMLKVLIPQKTSEPMVSYVSDEPVIDEPVKEKVVSEVKKKPSSPSSSAVSILTVNAPSEISIPVPEVEVETLSVEFGESDGFGDGWDKGTGNGPGGAGGGFATPFGRTDGKGLKGSFYDLKIDYDKKMTSIGKFYEGNGGVPARLPVFRKKVVELSKAKFRDSELKKYFKADTELSFTNLMIDPRTSAVEAPKAFNVDGQVEPSAWLVVYEGKIDPPKNGGYYRFSGTFDDFLLVYINGKLALDASFPSNRFNPKLGTNPGANLRHKHHHSNWLRLGKNTDIKIIVSESPGGHMGGGLFVQEKGKEYKPDGHGGVILPPFTTEPLREEDKERLRNMKNFGGDHFKIELDDVPVFTIRN